MDSGIATTSTTHISDATNLTCHDTVCTNLDCLIHSLKRPSAALTPPSRCPTAKELQHASEPIPGNSDVWTNIALSSPPPVYTITSFDGAGDNLTMSGAVDASAMEKGYQSGQRIYAIPNSTIGMP